MAEPDRAHDAEVLRPQHAARLEQRRAGDDVLAAPADVLARRDGATIATMPSGASGAPLLDELGREHGVAAGRHRRAGHDAHGLAARDASARTGDAGQRVADDRQRDAVVRRRAFRAIRDDGVAVHRGAIEAGHVDVADDGRGEHAARGGAQRDVFGVERMQLRVEPRQRRLHRVAPREALHADVVVRRDLISVTSRDSERRAQNADTASRTRCLHSAF